jgi:hypothetical protein
MVRARRTRDDEQFSTCLGRLERHNCESSRPLSDVLVINDNCLWTNGSWRNKNAGLDHIE